MMAVPPPLPIRFSLEEVLPVIRRALAVKSDPGDALDDIFAIYRDRLVLLSARRSEPTPDSAFTSEGASALLAMKGVGHKIVLSWDDVSRVEISAVHSFGTRWTRQVGRELRIVTNSLAATRLFLPEEDSQLVRYSLRMILGERFQEKSRLVNYQPKNPLERRREGSPETMRALWLSVLTVPFVAGALILSTGGIPAPNWIKLFTIFAAVCLLAVLVVSLIIESSRGFYYRSQFKRRRELDRIRAHRETHDLSRRRPLRSRALGWVLKSFGVVVWLAAELVSLEAEYYPGYKYLTLSMGSVALIYLGYRLCLRPAETALNGDARAPILFLRPFATDGRTNFNPRGLLAQILGLEAFGFSWIKNFEPVANCHPLRVLRLLFSATADDSEEQMARFFRACGPFVAIGRPGESLSQGGAYRLYVGDDEWQKAVLDLLPAAQFTVLQPSLTPGVQWEIEQATGLIPPERLLLCLTSFEGNQARYDTFRLHFERSTHWRLPRPIGDGGFACFDSGYLGRLLPLQLRAPVFWPIFGCAVNFKKTLDPFLSVLQRRSPTKVKSAQKKRLFWQGALAVAVWIPLLFVLDDILGRLALLARAVVPGFVP
jgi:hypothetical protein